MMKRSLLGYQRPDGRVGFRNHYSTVLDDGSILTAFGNYLAGGELIKWKP